MKQVIALSLLTLLAASFAAAQETTGSIVGTVTSQDGLPLPGVLLEASNPLTGLVRSTTADGAGRFRLPSLPPASYTLVASLDGFQTQRASAEVAVGTTVRHDFEILLGAFDEVLEVLDEVPALDPSTTVTGLTVDSDELSSRLPIHRDVTQMAMLVPGTRAADNSFESSSSLASLYTPGQSLASFGGASIAENSYIVNGLNITSLSYLMGSSYVPMEFVDQVQVKTGGYEAEFGRSTGGVINLVTKSGGNSFRGAVSAFWSPGDLQENEPDTYRRESDGTLSVNRHNQDEERRSLEANASLGGPLLEDRLFFFGFVRWAAGDSLEVWEENARRQEAGDPYWGGKLDWQITPSHRLEGTYFSDAVDVRLDLYRFDPELRSLGEFVDRGIRSRGGPSAVLRYTGVLSDRWLLSGQAGLNEFDNSNQSDRGDVCPWAIDSRVEQFERIGCWIASTVGESSNQRTAYRADLDGYLGGHALRAGADLETSTSTVQAQYSGGTYYRYFLNGTRYPNYRWNQELVRIWNYVSDGSYDAVSNAAYLQDSWALTPGLTLNLGVRWERFDTRNAEGERILEISDQIAPRLGVAWDPRGDGRSKLYGSYGVYHLPMSTSASSYLGERYFSDEAWHVLEGGVDPDDGSPIGIGEGLDYSVLHEWGVSDPTAAIDNSIEPMSQRELVVGYEQLLGSEWSIGVRGIAREFEQVIEDILLDQALNEEYGLCSPRLCWHWVLTNPGTDFNGWFDVDLDPELDPVSFTAEQLGIPSAERKYFAAIVEVDRRFAGGWMLHGSYTWSHNYGNYEGLVNSDIGQVEPYLTYIFDVSALLEHGRGDLPNDRRHGLELYGTYAWQGGLRAGGFAWYRSGRPVNGFGYHPTDPWAQEYANKAFYNGGEPCPRGCAGTSDPSWALDLMLGYDFDAFGADWRLRLDAFNLFDNDTATELDEQAELLWLDADYNPVSNPSYLMPEYHQRPRSIRFGFGVQF